MKLKDDYILYSASEDEMIGVATGEEAEKFKGLLRANKTAGAIMEYLKEDISMDELVSKMTERFDASAEVIKEDIQPILEQLKSIGALEE